ncbi:MAG: terminase large subunit [Phycisphaerae bacterium]|nr:terminase large subunit [Phycisphaerae bacterium]
MGARGPKAKPLKEQASHGAWRAIAELKRQRRDKAAKEITANVEDLPRITKAMVLRDIKRLPGYDPQANWGRQKFWFDVDEAIGRITFFHEVITHCKGPRARQPFILEPWQRGFVANLFGWKRFDKKGKKVDKRRFREALLFIPRKNGKSPLTAGLLLCLLDMDHEPGAEIYGAASTFEQASFVFDYALGMVNNSEYLSSRYKPYKGQRKAIASLEDPLSVYKVISGEHGTKHGQNAYAAVIDELHVLPDRGLLDTIRTAFGARPEPLLICLTTSDYDRPDSPCNEKQDLAESTLRGDVIKPTFLPVIFKADPEDDWRKWSTVKKANPNLGVSVTEEYLREALAEAKRSVLFENEFKRLHLNLRTEQAVRFFELPQWEACIGEVNPVELRGKTSYAGLDLASTSDLTCLALVFPWEGGSYKVLLYTWLPEDAVHDKQNRAYQEHYHEWQRAGLVETTPGDMIDYGHIRQRIGEIATEYPIAELAVDRLFQGAQLASELQQDGFTVASMGQGYLSMAAPLNEVDRLYKAGLLEHGGNPVLRWCAANAEVKLGPDGKPLQYLKTKRKAKIDAVVTLTMAIGRAMLHAGEKPSRYSQGKGLRAI